MRNITENAWIDHLFRGQPLSMGAKTSTWDAAPSVWVGLLSVAPTGSTAGTEFTGTSYARVEVPCSLVAWAGTQGAGTVAASSGTTGITSNNAPITFATPGSSWGTAKYAGAYDAATGGNLLHYAALDTPVTILMGDIAPVIPAGSLTFKLGS